MRAGALPQPSSYRSPPKVLSCSMPPNRGSGLLSQRMFSSGISSRNREARLLLVRPYSIRWRALVRVSFSLARVMAT